MDPASTVATNLRQIRLSRGWSFDDAAVATGFDAEVLEGIEQGRTFVSTTRVALLAERLGVSTSALTN